LARVGPQRHMKKETHENLDMIDNVTLKYTSIKLIALPLPILYMVITYLLHAAQSFFRI